MLLPYLYNPQCPKRYKIGLIPSWVDFKDTKDQYRGNKDIRIINVFDPIEEVMNDICKCEMTLASALHGLIVSSTYGIPTKWVEFSDRIIGDGTKYKDFLQSINMNYEPADLRKLLTTTKLARLPIKHKIDIDLKLLWDSCPFKRSTMLFV